MVSAIWNVHDHDFALSVPDLAKFRTGIGDFDNWKPPSNNPLKVVVDLGAHVGAFSLYIRHFYDAQMIYAYEPVPLTLQHLIGSITMNGYWGKIIPMPYAVCHVDDVRVGVMKGITYGQFSLEFNDQLKLEFSPVAVPLLPITDMLTWHDRIDFLKIDIEGSEWGIFDDLISNKVASDLFREKVAYTMIELHPLNETTYFKGSTGSNDRIEKYLASNGYDVEISDDQWRTIKATRKS